MYNTMNRREMLKASGLLAAGVALSPFWDARALADAVVGPRKRVLFFTKSAGFQHGPITRPAGEPDKLAFAEQILTDVGARNGFDVTCSKDGRVFTPENIASYDAFAFYTTGVLTEDSDKYVMKGPKGKQVPDTEKLLHKEPGIPKEGLKAFFDAIEGGKGFVGFHSATDTFHSPKHVRGEMIRNVDEQGKDQFDPYIQMIGGEFIVHGKQQPATLKAIDPKFPGAAAFHGASFPEEWYSLTNFAPDLHVILAQDCKGMEGPMYQRGMFPETWARMHGKGRVFYTSMGHREDVWTKPEYQALIMGALNWATGRVEVGVKPNIKEATPDAEPGKKQA